MAEQNRNQNVGHTVLLVHANEFHLLFKQTLDERRNRLNTLFN